MNVMNKRNNRNILKRPILLYGLLVEFLLKMLKKNGVIMVSIMAFPKSCFLSHLLLYFENLHSKQYRPSSDSSICISFVCLFCCFLPKSKTMVMAGWSVQLIKFFPGHVNQYFMHHILTLVTDNNPS